MSKTATLSEVRTEQEIAGQQAWRETVESIVVAVILAFLFRAFVAEAFVIPTGSMAPTLQGRHLDVECEQCGHSYRTGASMENDGSARRVTRTTCPICRFPMTLDRTPAGRVLFRGNQDSFNGDRILVSKFAYQLGQPQRWDVIVFKYPGNAKQNYIKRLVGLPGETIKIQHGDILVAPPEERHKQEIDDRQFSIARKPPSKVKAMLHLVDDTNHIAPLLQQASWPSRWKSDIGSDGWQVSSAGSQFTTQPTGGTTAWLRYRHLVPSMEDWLDLINEERPDGLDERQGQLITDYYAYNDFYPGSGEAASSYGSCWVGDLAIECQVQVQSDGGELFLDLVEGGVHHTCRIDVSSGSATLSRADGRSSFEDAAGNAVQHPTAATSVKGKGKYHLRMSNVDDQVLLWVNERLVKFDGPTTYIPEGEVVPRWTSGDPGDIEPVGIGSRGGSLQVSDLRVLRDIYYQAVDSESRKSEYRPPTYEPPMTEIQQVFSDPRVWASTNLFERRRAAVFELAEDQFFPMGDNSPQSKDARLWTDRQYFPPAYVGRELLIGKALLIYWPHMWRPLLPNFSRMGPIR